MEEVTVTIQIKGDKGQVHTKGKTIGFLTEGQQTEHTYEMKVNQKEKTFELSSMKLGYEIKGGELTITSDSTGILAGKSFKKEIKEVLCPRKSIFSGLLVASSVLLLAACGQQASQTSEGESTDATVQTSASKDKKAEQAKIDYQIVYQNILDSYRERVKAAQNQQMPQYSTGDKEESYIDSILFDYKGIDISYTFYDINKDGKKELLIKQDKILLGIYYLTDQGTLLVSLVE